MDDLIERLEAILAASEPADSHWRYWDSDDGAVAVNVHPSEFQSALRQAAAELRAVREAPVGECAALDAALASLSAPQPPAEAQPVAWEARDPDDGTRWVTRSPRERDGWQGLGRTIRPLVYGDTDPPPSAPVGVEAMPGLRRELAGIVRRDDAEMVSIEPNEAAAILRALAQQPAAVADLNAWRAAFIAERATRYRESGMAIEQASIHAETDAALMEKTTSQPQQPAATQDDIDDDIDDDTSCAPGNASWQEGFNAGMEIGRKEAASEKQRAAVDGDLIAAVEALRVDVEAWKASHSLLTYTCHHFQARAERLADAAKAKADKWDRIGDEHGVRQFTGNDHKLFANELRALLREQEERK